MINWQFFPKSTEIPKHLKSVVEVFEACEKDIDSSTLKLKSNDVLSVLCRELEKIGYEVEKGKKSSEKIHVPVLFGLNGSIDKYFEADAYNKDVSTVIEVEAGRGVLNNQFLKDLFQACVMHKVEYLVTAVRNDYLGKKDFQTVLTFYETLYASNRLNLPLKGILIIGY